MKKKRTPSIAEIAALVGIVTTSLTQLVPLMDAHPVGGTILATSAIAGSLCWVMKLRE